MLIINFRIGYLTAVDLLINLVEWFRFDAMIDFLMRLASRFHVEPLDGQDLVLG